MLSVCWFRLAEDESLLQHPPKFWARVKTRCMRYRRECVLQIWCRLPPSGSLSVRFQVFVDNESGDPKAGGILKHTRQLQGSVGAVGSAHGRDGGWSGVVARRRVRPLQRRLDVKFFRLAFTGGRRELMSRACSARAPRYRRAQQYGAKRCCAGSEHEAITVQGQEEVCGSVPSVSNGSGQSIGSLGL